MSLFDGMEQSQKAEVEKDVLGGSRILDSGIYPTRIEHAYQVKSSGGALGIALSLVTPEGQKINKTIYISTKAGKTFYVKDGKEYNLPGYSLMSSLATLLTDKSLVTLETEDKVVKVFDFNTKAEVPTTVPMLTELVGKEVYTGVLRQIVDKNVKTDEGTYVPTGETREENEIAKFFDAQTKQTASEMKAGNSEAEFFDKWKDKFSGEVLNKAKGAAGKAGAPKAAVNEAKPKKSLFE